MNCKPNLTVLSLFTLPLITLPLTIPLKLSLITLPLKLSLITLPHYTSSHSLHSLITLPHYTPSHSNTPSQVGPSQDKSRTRVVYSYLGNIHYCLGQYGRSMEYHRQVCSPSPRSFLDLSKCHRR